MSEDYARLMTERPDSREYDESAPPRSGFSLGEVARVVTTSATPPAKRPYRQYSREFKERILAEIDSGPRGILKEVARREDISPSLVHQWRAASGRGDLKVSYLPGSLAESQSRVTVLMKDQAVSVARRGQLAAKKDALEAELSKTVADLDEACARISSIQREMQMAITALAS